MAESESSVEPESSVSSVEPEVTGSSVTAGVGVVGASAYYSGEDKDSGRRAGRKGKLEDRVKLGVGGAFRKGHCFMGAY